MSFLDGLNTFLYNNLELVTYINILLAVISVLNIILTIIYFLKLGKTENKDLHHKATKRLSICLLIACICGFTIICLSPWGYVTFA